MANYLHCEYCINKEGCPDRILFDGVVVFCCANHVYSRELHNEMRRKKKAEMKRIAEMDALGEQKENYDGHCGCKSIEECGYCFKTREVEE